MHPFTRIVESCLLAALLAMAPMAWAADEEMEVETNDGGLDLSAAAGVDWTTHYFFRGILQENQGAIVQPYGSVTAGIWEGDGAISSLSGTIGTWHSIHSGPSGGDGSSPIDDPTWWYEADLYGGLSAAVLEDFTVSATWTAYTSPNRAFDTVQDITFGLTYDDSSWWGDSGFTLAPSFAAVVETNNEADGGNSVGGATGSDEGVYYQLGIRPTFAVTQSEDSPITLAIPVIVGLGDNYYEIDRNGDGAIDDDATFGYFSAGAVLSVPVPLPGGDWTASAGATALFLGDTTEFINNGEDFEVIGTLSLGVAF